MLNKTKPINLKRIFQAINQKKTIKSSSLPILTKKNLEQIVKRFFNVFKKEIQSNIKPEINLWDYTWSSMATAKKRKYKNHRKISYIESFIEQTLKRLSKKRLIVFNYSYSGGANYHGYLGKSKKSADIINIPCIKRFKQRRYYYKTIFHELTHCIMKRTGVDLVINSDDDEEVIAEMTASILCFFFGMDTWNESYKYINDYMTNYKGQVIHLGRQKYIKWGINKTLQYAFHV